MSDDAHFDTFITEAIKEEGPTEAGLSPDELYGLYTSWCLLNNEPLQPTDALWRSLEVRGISPTANRLGMKKGPAAADYIVASAPNLV